VRDAYRRVRRTAGHVVRRFTRLPVCDDVLAWSAARGLEAHTLFPPRRVTRALPRTVEPTIHREYLQREVANQRGRYLVAIPGARLVSGDGIVVLPDGRFATESVYTRDVLEQNHQLHGIARRPIVERPGEYFSLIVRWSRSGNYYHWMHDTLTRLYAASERLPRTTRYIVPADLSPLQRETLRLVGLDDEQLVPFAGDEVWQLEVLHFAPPTTSSGSDRRDADLWVRDRILEGFGITPASTGRRLFVSRRMARRRRLVNEEAVEACLRGYGFETCIAESLSLREQVATFAQADAVVSTHGAGFTNMLFSPPGLRVLDMLEPAKSHQAYVFWAMAEELGHEYWYFFAESVARPTSQNDALVPLPKLTASLDRMFGSPRGSS
jgi:capsular polysaccharide biosynthesis protein